MNGIDEKALELAKKFMESETGRVPKFLGSAPNKTNDSEWYVSFESIGENGKVYEGSVMVVVDLNNEECRFAFML